MTATALVINTASAKNVKPLTRCYSVISVSVKSSPSEILQSKQKSFVSNNSSIKTVISRPSTGFALSAFSRRKEQRGKYRPALRSDLIQKQELATSSRAATPGTALSQPTQVYKSPVPDVYWSNFLVSSNNLEHQQVAQNQSKPNSFTLTSTLTPNNINKQQCEQNKLHRAVQYYSNQALIEKTATKQIRRIKPQALLVNGTNSIKLANFLIKELPVRIAHRIVDFRCLPFIAWTKISHVHDQYIRAFHLLSQFESIKTKQEELDYAATLRGLLLDHRNVVADLAEGFRACRKQLEHESIIQSFIDRTLASRLGIRLLAEHYIALHNSIIERNEKADMSTDLCTVGIMNNKMNLKALIERWCNVTSSLCVSKYGIAPEFVFDGHLDSAFPYFELPLNYIIPELIKNSARATIEHHFDKSCTNSTIPPINITIANNSSDFIIKISDFGGGIPRSVLDKVTNYHFSTSPNSISTDVGSISTDTTSLEDFSVELNKTRTSAREKTYYRCNNTSLDDQLTRNNLIQCPEPVKLDDETYGYNDSNIPIPEQVTRDMHGYGFGLPISRAYATYLAGSLDLVSMQGLGTDVFLRLTHLNSSESKENSSSINEVLI